VPNPRVVVFVSSYKRPEYTAACLVALEESQKYFDNVSFFFIDDGSNDGTFELFSRFPRNKVVVRHSENKGLRFSIIEFFGAMKLSKPDYIFKVDNDCIVPANWLNDLLKIMKDQDVDILSPNTSETNAAHKYGFINKRKAGFIPSMIVGGLWCMKIEMIEGIYFEQADVKGIRCAFNLINQITAEKEPKIGWTDEVTYQDVGYLSGSHHCHIKSKAHAEYSAEVGRPVSWTPEDYPCEQE